MSLIEAFEERCLLAKENAAQFAYFYEDTKLCLEVALRAKAQCHGSEGSVCLVENELAVNRDVIEMYECGIARELSRQNYIWYADRFGLNPDRVKKLQSLSRENNPIIAQRLRAEIEADFDRWVGRVQEIERKNEEFMEVAITALRMTSNLADYVSIKIDEFAKEDMPILLSFFEPTTQIEIETAFRKLRAEAEVSKTV